MNSQLPKNRLLMTVIRGCLNYRKGQRPTSRQWQMMCRYPSVAKHISKEGFQKMMLTLALELPIGLEIEL